MLTSLLRRSSECIVATCGLALVLVGSQPLMGQQSHTETSLVQTVHKQTPGLRWDPPQAISYGTPLGPAQLDAASPTDGSFSYTPSQGTILDAGSYTIGVSFQPFDAADYDSAQQSVPFEVIAASSVVDLTVSSTRILLNSPISLSASITAPGIHPSGDVTFQDSGTVLGVAELNNGSAALNSANLGLGQHSIIASYTGNRNFQTESSAALSVTVIDYSFAAPPSTPPNPPAIPPGGSVTYPLAFTVTNGNSLPQIAFLQLSGLPAFATAHLNSAAWVETSPCIWTLKPGTPLETVFLILSTTRPTMQNAPSHTSPAALSFLGCTLLLIPFCRRTGRERAKLLSFSMLAILATFTTLLSGCANIHLAPQPQTYPLTVSIHAGALERQTNLVFSVE